MIHPKNKRGKKKAGGEKEEVIIDQTSSQWRVRV
jgi:hypothetical protein